MRMKIRIETPQHQIADATPRAANAPNTQGAMPMSFRKKPLAPVGNVQVKTMQPEALSQLRAEVQGTPEPTTENQSGLTATGTNKGCDDNYGCSYPYFIYIPAITISQFIEGNTACAVECNGQTAILTGRPNANDLGTSDDSLAIVINTSDSSQMAYTGSNGNYALYCMSGDFNIYSQPWQTPTNYHCTAAWYMIFDSVFDTNTFNKPNPNNCLYPDGTFKNNNYNVYYNNYSPVLAYPAIYCDMFYGSVPSYYNIWFVMDVCMMGFFMGYWNNCGTDYGFHYNTYTGSGTSSDPYSGDIWHMFQYNPGAVVDYELFGSQYFYLPMQQYSTYQTLYFLKNQPSVYGPEIDP